MPLLTEPRMRDDERVAVDFDPAWSVRSMFGGALAATSVRAARMLLGTPLPLSEALFSFVAPTPPGPAVVHVAGRRAGRRFAGAEVRIESAGTVTMRGMLTFARPTRAAAPSEATPPLPTLGVPAFGGAAEWSAPTRWQHADTASGDFTSWVRARGELGETTADEWACIAADLAGPALVGAVTGPFAVATATLSVAMHSTATAPNEWWRQVLTATVDDGVASSRLELRAPSGTLIARSAQRAVILPADAAELPRSVTAFAGSGNGSRLIGMN